ncbi:MAG: glycoside hydrolase family 16 protein [Deinococcales bacterium]
MDFPANPVQKAGYTLEFADEFEGNKLDTTKWLPQMLPHWSTPEVASARFRVTNGQLELRIEADQPRWRENADRVSNLQTGHHTGQFCWDSTMTISSNPEPLQFYLPQYGYLETRLKALPVQGYHTAFWLIGYDAPQAGEIRVFEIHGGNITPQRSRIDYAILAWNDPNLQNQIVEDWLPVNAAEYNIYAIDWTPEYVDFFVNNKHLRRLEQRLPYRMQLMLGLYERPHEINPDNPVFPKIAVVDYVRGYRKNPLDCSL